MVAAIAGVRAHEGEPLSAGATVDYSDKLSIQRSRSSYLNHKILTNCFLCLAHIIPYLLQLLVLTTCFV